MKTESSLSTCHLVRAGQEFVGKQGLTYSPAISAESVGACALHKQINPGDFLYNPADMPHLPYNHSATETSVAHNARTDPNEQESVVLLPHLDGVAATPSAL